MQKRARDGLRTPSWAVLAAKLAVLAAKLAFVGAKMPARGAQMTPRTASEPSLNAFLSSNSVRIDFSSLLGTIVESPNLNFRQPVQCFVHFGRS